MIKSETKIIPEFANIEKANTILTTNDEYVQSMHPYEWSLKMQVSQEISKERYFAFLTKNILEWNKNEKIFLKTVINKLNIKLAEHKINICENIVFIKTTGHEEWNCAYTRSNAIILPERKLNSNNDKIAILRLISHEFFHILTRRYPKLKSVLYAIIGFQKIENSELLLPEKLKQKALTNPDSPINDHYITIMHNGNTAHVTPITLLKNQLANVDTSQDIIESLETHLLVLDKKSDKWNIKMIDKQPCVFDIKHLEGNEYFDISGKIFEPEEILAECFVNLLVTNQEPPFSKIIRQMKDNLSYFFDSKETTCRVEF
ncbi:MAG: hypothetical protein GY714_05685 [Desulfobacterales bacterium]|nr:hypothetical protein [Desulfobacterales bacterium]